MIVNGGMLSDVWKDFLVEWKNEATYIVAHTSGSTGSPKEIHLPKSDMIASAEATNRRFGIDRHSRILCPLSPGYIAGKMMMVRAIAAGCEIVIEAPSNHPMQRDYGDIDLMAVVPSQCHALIDNETARNRLKSLIIGGASIPTGIESALLAMPWQSFATYGMTETCSHVALRTIGTDVYVAMPGILFALDNRGCLAIEAPGFSFRQLVTNDMVELLSPHAFRWLGRYDNVINSGGVKFHPEVLENMLEWYFQYPFYFKGEPDEKWGESVGMVIETDGTTDAETLCSEALSACRMHLPPYAIPKHITIVPSLLRTSNGKIRR